MDTNITTWDSTDRDGIEMLCLTRIYENNSWDCHTSRSNEPWVFNELGFNENITEMLEQNCVHVFLTLKGFCKDSDIPEYCSTDYLYKQTIKALSHVKKNNSFGISTINDDIRYLRRI